MMWYTEEKKKKATILMDSMTSITNRNKQN